MCNQCHASTSCSAQSENACVSKSVKKLSIWRRIVQFIFLFIMGKWVYYGVFRCPYIVPFVNCESCSMITCWGRITTYFYAWWIIIPIMAVLFGRAFCSWFCPSGWVNQMLGKLSISKWQNRKSYMRLFQLGMVTMVVLGAIVYFKYGNPRIMIPIRTSDEYFNAVILSMQFSEWYWAARTITVVSIIAESLIIANVWCRFVCPVGGIMELIRKISIFRVYKTDACDDCDACLRVCEMGTRPDEMNCTNCGECLHVCHKNAIKFGRKG